VTGAILVSAVLSALSVPAGALEIPVTVTEPAGVARRAAPISGGIPLPPGKVARGQGFAVRTADGRELPAQATPLVVDPDGSPRWVLVDFQDDLPAKATNRYILATAKTAAKPAKPLRVTDAPEAVTVDTGAMRWTISRTAPFGLFSTVRAGGKDVVRGGSVAYTDGLTGETFQAGAPEYVKVEYAGPVRVTVAARGRFVGDKANRFQYVARITAWANSTRVHVKYSLANSNPDHYCFRTVKASRIALELAGEPTATVLGGSKPIQAGAESELVQTLLPRAAGGAKASSGGQELWSSAGASDRADGWILARTPAGGVWACDLYFADDPARRLAVADGSLILEGVIQRPADQAAAKGRPYQCTDRFLYDCSHLSSQYVIDFAAPTDPAALPEAARRSRYRPHLFAKPAWYLQETDALPLGRFGTQADEMACYDKWGWKYDPARAPKAPPRRRTYGRFFRGTDAHYTPEEDALDQMLIMYMRTGSRAYLENARSWSNYAMDLYAWRTDGWRWTDGGVWWRTGPKGNRPQRPADPVTGVRNYVPAPWSKKLRKPWTAEMVRDSFFLGDSKSCYCHNWNQGLLAWYCLTGDRDAVDAAIDRVEQDVDTIRRARGYTAGKADGFSRDFTRSSYNVHAARMILPDNEFIREASDYFAAVYLKRPTPEPRGFVNAARGWGRRGLRGGLEAWVGKGGLEALAASGNVLDAKTGTLTDPRTGKSWRVLVAPHTWMFPPLSRAMDLYWRLTGDEDALDWTIAYGQAAARVLYQPHGNLAYGKMLADFPARGVVKDYATWVSGPDNRWAKGVRMSGYLARFYPDVCARAYALCGEPFLKRRAYDFWNGGSHRGYNTTDMKPLDRVGMWVDYHSDHDGQTDFIGRTFWIWSHPRADTTAPAAVKDLKVTVRGGSATVRFTAPADTGGKVARYQLKCSDRPMVDYQSFLAAYSRLEEEKVCNWWMAQNLRGEPAPGRAGSRESFTVTNVPKDAKYFAIRAFDDSGNRARLSNVAQGR